MSKGLELLDQSSPFLTLLKSTMYLMKPQRTFDERKHGLSLSYHAMIDTEVPIPYYAGVVRFPTRETWCATLSRSSLSVPIPQLELGACQRQ